MLTLLDHYLYDNPRQHIHCMSHNTEYITLLNHAICLQIDISLFPTVWVVLSVLLDTQDNKSEYVKSLQGEYNRYYEHKTKEYVEKLEEKAIAIQMHMHDRVAYDFDRISDHGNNGTTLSRDIKMNSQKLLMLQRSPLTMMNITY